MKIQKPVNMKIRENCDPSHQENGWCCIVLLYHAGVACNLFESIIEFVQVHVRLVYLEKVWRELCLETLDHEMPVQLMVSPQW